MIKELKAAVIGLNDKGFQGSALWFRLVNELIVAYELDEDIQAIVFWKKRKNFFTRNQK